MPSSRDSFRRNRVAPLSNILALIAKKLRVGGRELTVKREVQIRAGICC